MRIPSSQAVSKCSKWRFNESRHTSIMPQVKSRLLIQRPLLQRLPQRYASISQLADANLAMSAFILTNCWQKHFRSCQLHWHQKQRPRFLSTLNLSSTTSILPRASLMLSWFRTLTTSSRLETPSILSYSNWWTTKLQKWREWFSSSARLKIFGLFWWIISSLLFALLRQTLISNSVTRKLLLSLSRRNWLWLAKLTTMSLNQLNPLQLRCLKSKTKFIWKKTTSSLKMLNRHIRPIKSEFEILLFPEVAKSGVRKQPP